MKSDWNPDKWVPIWEDPARAIQWVPTWKGLDGFQKSLPPCALDERSLRIGRIIIYVVHAISTNRVRRNVASALEGLRGGPLDLWNYHHFFCLMAAKSSQSIRHRNAILRYRIVMEISIWIVSHIFKGAYTFHLPFDNSVEKETVFEILIPLKSPFKCWYKHSMCTITPFVSKLFFF